MCHPRIFMAAAFILVTIAGEGRAQPGSAESLVASWYHRYLEREPDPTGFYDHVRALRGGAPPVAVEAEILGSEEYYRLQGANPRGFVFGLFRDVLGRPPAPGEMAYWLDRVRDEGRAGAARSFLLGPRR